MCGQRRLTKVRSLFNFSKSLSERLNQVGVVCSPYEVYRDLGVAFSANYRRYIRVKGKGITPKGRRTGDFYVKVGIVVPEYTRAAKRELQKFKDKGYEGDSPREYLNE